MSQNLVFAFACNVAGIPIAAGVLYPVNGLLLSSMIDASATALVLGQRHQQRLALAHPHLN